MKNLFKLSLALIAGMLMFASCSDDDPEIPEQDEMVMNVFLVTDTTVTIKCAYTPKKSVAYQLMLGKSASQKYSTLKYLKIHNLSPNRKYTVKATIFDAEQEAIGRSELTFNTLTSDLLPDYQMGAPLPISFEDVGM